MSIHALDAYHPTVFNLCVEEKQNENTESEHSAEIAPNGWVFGLPFQTLLSREVRRFVRVWTQTLLAPLLTSALYVVVFGYGLGSRTREVEGVPYLEFILPDLILLSIIAGSYGNTSSSLFDVKRERYSLRLGRRLAGNMVGAGTFALASPLAASQRSVP